MLNASKSGPGSPQPPPSKSARWDSVAGSAEISNHVDECDVHMKEQRQHEAMDAQAAHIPEGKGREDEILKEPNRPDSKESKHVPAFAASTQDNRTVSTAFTSSMAPEAERAIISVSASKNPTEFMKLAKRFLVTDEICDLSALEGAIVTAIDAALLLERSQLATITRIQTSFVTMEGKRKTDSLEQTITSSSTADFGVQTPFTVTSSTERPPDSTATANACHTSPIRESLPGNTRPSSGGQKEVRRARILITVRRTEQYTKWLEENPFEQTSCGVDDYD